MYVKILYDISVCKEPVMLTLRTGVAYSIGYCIMNFSIASAKMRTLLIILLVFIGLGSFIYTQYLVSRLREKERNSVELWAKAIEYNGNPQNVDIRSELELMEKNIDSKPYIPDNLKKLWKDKLQRARGDLANAALDFVASELIIKNRFQIPSVVTDSNKTILYSRNIVKKKLGPKIVKELAEKNRPIEIVVGSGDKSQKQYVFYGESATVKMLRFLPYLQFGLLAIFLGLAYYSWSSVRENEQSNLWVGMAKEAAHQLGTPISSLLGWIALMNEANNDENMQKIILELTRDVERLQDVAERFNKIGSAPELKTQRVGPVLDEVVGYMQRRMPQLGKNVNLISKTESRVKLKLNAELFQWAIENLIKNALDAIEVKQNGSYIKVTSFQLEKDYIIEIEDSGKGIEKKNYKEIFKPGFSTKKRGWGLGLSLTKRIIEEYHRGKIFVSYSSPGKGTIIRIEIPAVDDVVT